MTAKQPQAEPARLSLPGCHRRRPAPAGGLRTVSSGPAAGAGAAHQPPSARGPARRGPSQRAGPVIDPDLILALRLRRRRQFEVIERPWGRRVNRVPSHESAIRQAGVAPPGSLIRIFIDGVIFIDPQIVKFTSGMSEVRRG